MRRCIFDMLWIINSVLGPFNSSIPYGEKKYILKLLKREHFFYISLLISSKKLLTSLYPYWKDLYEKNNVFFYFTIDALLNVKAFKLFLLTRLFC